MVIVVRLAWLQLGEHKKFLDIAAQQQQHGFEIAPRRGVLYDRNMRELAMTVSVDSVFAVPSEIKDKAATAAALAEVVHSDPTENFTTSKQIAARLQDSRNFAWIARKLDPDVIAKVKALKLKGIYFQKEFKRIYPNDELAAQVLGYVGTDDTGLGGIERKFDPDLHGTPGHMLTSVDAKRHVLGSLEREPLPGENLQLSVDENIQFMAEKALDHAMEKYHAQNGTVVIQDVHTGQILALAIRPTFNPNDFRHATNGLLRNHAVSDIYEPGSTFKLVTYSAALDAAGVKPDDIVDCQGGSINLYGRVIHDDKSDIGIGKVTVQRALERSSDVGAVKMALKLGNEKFYDYIKAFGFGDRTGVELPAETRGLLRPVRKWDPASIGSLAIGQEVGVTPVQLAAMVSTIANGGIYLPPHILAGQQAIANGKLQAVPMKPGDGVPSPLPEGAHRVISEMTAAQMRRMMEGIVLNGTGKEATLNGYSSGGKTGTAQKIDVVTHTYSKTKHIASFAGIAPVSNPAITVAVVIDSPEGASYYGSAVSAPVFAQIAQQTLEYLGVPYDREVKATRGMPSKAVPAEDLQERASEHGGNEQALFAGVGDLPKDDPLRANAEANTATASPVANMDVKNASLSSPAGAAPAVVAAKSTPVPEGMVAAPMLLGKPLRAAMETLMSAGLHLQAVGSGLARSQSPAPGTPVAPGGAVVVRFSR